MEFNNEVFRLWAWERRADPRLIEDEECARLRADALCGSYDSVGWQGSVKSFGGSRRGRPPIQFVNPVAVLMPFLRAEHESWI